MDGATLADAWLWETQRSGWRIKGVICERAIWNRQRELRSAYRPSEFEHAYGDKPVIHLLYADGMAPVDVALLPMIIERLQAEHPQSALRIRSIRNEGGGAAVEITVDDLADRTPDVFQEEMDHLRTQVTHLLGQVHVYQEQFMPIFREMAQMAKVQIGSIHGPTVVEGTQSIGSISYVTNDLDGTRKLIADLFADRSRWEQHVADSRHADFKFELAKLREELVKPTPDVSMLTAGLHSLKNMVENAAAPALYGSIQAALIALRNAVA